MKKLLKITIMVLMTILINNTTAYATNLPIISLRIGNKQIRTGDTTSVDILIQCEDGIEGFETVLKYDNTKFELLEDEIEIDDEFTELSGQDEKTGEYKLTIISNTAEIIKESQIATLKFKVLDNVKTSPEAIITLSNIRIGDAQEAWTSLVEKDVKFEVIDFDFETFNSAHEAEELIVEKDYKLIIIGVVVTIMIIVLTILILFAKKIKDKN